MALNVRAIISHTFRLELLKRRADGLRAYQIADAARVRRNELSGIASGSIKVRRDDPRVGRLAALLGLPIDACFEAEPEDVAS